MSQEEREPRREDTPFDEDPPIDPSVPQVGNSRARFVLPADEEGPEADDDAPGEADDDAADETAPAEPQGGADG